MEEQITYDMYDVEIYDHNDDTVAMMDCIEDEFDAEELFDIFSPGAGGRIVLRKISYSRPDHTGYLKIEILKEKK